MSFENQAAFMAAVKAARAADQGDPKADLGFTNLFAKTIWKSSQLTTENVERTLERTTGQLKGNLAVIGQIRLAASVVSKAIDGETPQARPVQGELRF